MEIKPKVTITFCLQLNYNPSISAKALFAGSMHSGPAAVKDRTIAV